MANRTDHSEDMQFTWSDIWLLQAVGMAASKEPAALKNIIRAGDAIEHAIFDFEEMSSGFAKLIAAGYVVCEDGRFLLHPDFSPVYTRLAKQARTYVGNSKALEEFLRERPYPASDTTGKRIHHVLTQEDYEDAIRQYAGKH